MKPILKFLIPAFCATRAFALFDITPFLTCVTNDAATATTTAYLGYQSNEQSIITIPVGADNRIIPDPPNRNQPTLFFPGYYEKAFRVMFPSSTNIFWSFNGFAIPIGSNSVPCAPTAGSPLPLSLPPAMTLLPYSQQLVANLRQAAVTWSVVGALPAGLTLSPTGLLSGAPQTGGQTFITVQATDGFTTSQRTYGLLIGNGVTINDAVSTRAPGFTPHVPRSY